MKKYLFLTIVISALGVGLVFAAHIVAQSSSCVSLTTNLHVGLTDATTGNQVSQLQNFLIVKGYLVLPVGFSTGYFGQLTLRAASIFQVANSIDPPAGFVGPLTRAKIAVLSCNTITPPPLIIETNDVPPHIDSISPSHIIARNSLSGGSFTASFTIHGSNFSATSNEILMNGNHLLSNISSNGTSLSFTISEHCNGTDNTCSSDSSILFSPGTYAFSVKNIGGTSNSVNITVTDNQQTSSPHIDSISPTSGPVGTQIMVHGSGFTSSNNFVIFGTGIGSRYPNFNSTDGTTIIFTVPPRDNPMCPDSRACPIRLPDPISPGSYDIGISNANGTSNSINFTVTAN